MANKEVRTGHLSHAPMTSRDWGYLAVFLVVAASAGAWMGIELRKPFGITWEGVLVHQESPIEIIELNGEKIVRNKREGFEVRIPGEWGVEQPTLKSQKISFYTSQDATGCKIEEAASNNNLELSATQWVERFKSEELPFLTVKQFRETSIRVGGHDGVRLELESEEADYSVVNYVPVDNRMHVIAMYPGRRNLVVCLAQLDRFLNAWQVTE
ncbi:MAG: hypothetical protein AAB562_04945 [Patescibacteria group bacterium]